MTRRILYIFVLSTILSSCSSKLKPDSKIDKFYNYPNPFNSRNEKTKYKLILKDVGIAEAKVSIYSSDNTLITTFNLSIPDIANPNIAEAEWVGTDENGNYLPAYVYSVMIKVKDIDGNIYTSSTKTVLR